MKFTNKQIIRLLRIKDFVDIADTLARTYIDYDNRAMLIENFTDKDRMYRLYCSSIYNLVEAIKNSKDFFEKTRKYKDFEIALKQEFFISNKKYYSYENYRSTLYKIIENIRHYTNHYTKDDSADNILFDAYIDFELIENIRKIINDIFYEIYNQVDKQKIKQIILARPRIKYSLDKIANQLDELKLKISEENNRLNNVFKKDNDRAYELSKELFNPDNLYDLLTFDNSAINKFMSADNELQDMNKRMHSYIEREGTEMEKEGLKILDDFIMDNEGKNNKYTKENIEKLENKLNELKEKYNTNN